MKVLLSDLVTFVPALKKQVETEVAQTLADLGFEVEFVLNGVFDLTITPNRGDAMSALGVARDLAAFYGEPLPTVGDDAAYRALRETDAVSVTIEATSQLPQYHAIVIEDVTIQSSSGWLLDAVKALGWRPINSLVDLTNVLMDRFGQPLHVLDLDAIDPGRLTIRPSVDSESVTTLDGVVRSLPAGSIVIDDGQSIIDLLGIMGGESAEIRSTTRRVLLHAASINRTPIRAVTNATGLRTQAAIRYERGVDPELGPAVLSRVIELIGHESNGQRVTGRITSERKSTKARSVRISPKKVDHLLGYATSSTRQRELLTRLGCVVKGHGETLSVTLPSWRYDCEIWQDVAEEVARLEGLNDRLGAVPLVAWKGKRARSLIERGELVKDRLTALGFSEVLTYSFTSKELLEALEFEPGGELANPVNSTLKYLRPSLMPNLAAVVAANATFDPHLLFEIGHVFHGDTEEVRLGLVIAGQTQVASAWLSRIADALAIDSVAFTAMASVVALGREQLERLKIRKSHVTLVELALEPLVLTARISGDYRPPGLPVKYRLLSKYPPVSRDLALLVDTSVEPTAILEFIRHFTPLVEDAELFDVFQSGRLGTGTKSLAFHVWYAEPTRTLTEGEIAKVHEALVGSLEATFNATRR